MATIDPSVKIISVKYSGSRFLQELTRQIPEEKYYDLSHWVDSDFDLKDVKIISPIRHPHACMTGWYSRDEFGHTFFEEWERLDRAWIEGRTTIVPIDTIDRDARLAKLSLELNRPLITEWEKVGNVNLEAPPNIDLTRVYRLPVVQEFYGVTAWMF